jgi:hypothetical protein
MSNSPWNDRAKLVSACAVCDKKRTPIEVKVIGEHEDASLVHATCGRCGCATISLVLARGSAATTLGIATDLSAEDVARLRAEAPVSVDDVIDLHTYLERNLAQPLAGNRRIRSKTRKH